MKKFLFLCIALVFASFSEAKVIMPQLFQSGMVFQRGKTIPVWGKANPGETITVTFNKKTYTAIADTEGKWRVDMAKMKAGGPYLLKINDLEIDNILIGDVWLLSGQSNIDVHIERVYPQYTKEIDSYENTQIRLFRVQNETDVHGVRDDIRPTPINWKPLNKQNAWPFSAAGYFLGKQMFEKTKVPQGVIVNSWGGTPIEAWISKDSLENDYPMLVRKTMLYQNDNYVKHQAIANGEASKQWEAILNASDPGLLQNWTATTYDDASWQQINQYDWGWRGTGTVWLRQHINIDKAHAGQPARLLLGTLFDQDITYVNGKEVGHTYYQYPPRRYDIPEGLLHEGDNVITVRFINKFGAAHFIPSKPYLIAFGEDRCSQNPMPTDIIPLGETWKVKVGMEMPACPSGDVSLQNLPTTLYNAVLYPLAPYAINGIVWYQGESNTGNPAPYVDYLKKLMGAWRDRWQDQQMPFVIVQLANYDGRQQTGFPSPIKPQIEPANSNWAQLREAQRIVAKEDARAEFARIGANLKAKKEVAERIGLCFDRLIYNNKVKLSPEVIASEVIDGKIILTIDQPIESGTLNTFEVAADDGDRVFKNVQAQAEGSRITLTLPEGFHPLCKVYSVRYAWKDDPTTANANVRSLSGLPMSSFELKVAK